MPFSIQYFMIECFLEDNEAMLSGDPDQYDESIDWYAGERFEKPPKLPVRLIIESGEAGSGIIPEMSDVPIPVMTKHLAKTLSLAGISNIDFYDAVIYDEESGVTHTTHFAYNIVGVIAAANLEKTKFYAETSDRMISADIDSLSIDPTKTRNALMFRLAESVNGIVIHESVKNAIEAAGINTLTFIPPEEWVG